MIHKLTDMPARISHSSDVVKILARSTSKDMALLVCCTSKKLKICMHANAYGAMEVSLTT